MRCGSCCTVCPAVMCAAALCVMCCEMCLLLCDLCFCALCSCCRLGQVKLLDTSWYLPPMGASPARELMRQTIRDNCHNLSARMMVVCRQHVMV